MYLYLQNNDFQKYFHLSVLTADRKIILGFLAKALGACTCSSHIFLGFSPIVCQDIRHRHHHLHRAIHELCLPLCVVRDWQCVWQRPHPGTRGQVDTQMPCYPFNNRWDEEDGENWCFAGEGYLPSLVDTSLCSKDTHSNGRIAARLSIMIYILIEGSPTPQSSDLVTYLLVEGSPTPQSSDLVP